MAEHELLLMIWIWNVLILGEMLLNALAIWEEIADQKACYNPPCEVCSKDQEGNIDPSIQARDA